MPTLTLDSLAGGCTVTNLGDPLSSAWTPSDDVVGSGAIFNSGGVGSLILQLETLFEDPLVTGRITDAKLRVTSSMDQSTIGPGADSNVILSAGSATFDTSPPAAPPANADWTDVTADTGGDGVPIVSLINTDISALATSPVTIIWSGSLENGVTAAFSISSAQLIVTYDPSPWFMVRGGVFTGETGGVINNGSSVEASAPDSGTASLPILMTGSDYIYLDGSATPVDALPGGASPDDAFIVYHTTIIDASGDTVEYAISGLFDVVVTAVGNLPIEEPATGMTSVALAALSSGSVDITLDAAASFCNATCQPPPATWDIFAIIGTYSASAPVVTDVSPTHGDAAGGTVVTLTGTDLDLGTNAFFNGTAASGYSASSSTSATCVTPEHAVGPVTVTVV